MARLVLSSRDPAGLPSGLSPARLVLGPGLLRLLGKLDYCASSPEALGGHELGSNSPKKTSQLVAIALACRGLLAG
ncbi:uncharacterized protein PGTG_21406 [Puccinia graminis f. sp. tritici CRL 75-36-700-3]|uniref:Uncharacterized protein n=1 Tax=Puccinia graminis f. sp. tritici (strain CRL 75-36-700-3 / race SCCL) TaxID=418459 RepID=H6QR84_PUCGT|nr:uncharacterized protein PGTG_21406 [Puccinia graminis f. sp. tritici CRL 75-36-700-3]EHS63066.1 hypothetical protein PGTG_21406 [Puccinia graminis f. sp. tritici CRL 75-36-700-3]